MATSFEEQRLATGGFLQSKTPILLEKLSRGEPVIGVGFNTPSPEMIEILAFVGFDYVFVEQMFSPIDWRSLAELTRAARGSNLAVLARLENDPWFGGNDLGLAARAARAMGVGCDGVTVNVHGVEQARAAMSAAEGWHRNLHLTPFASSELPEQEELAKRDTLFVPGVESEQAIAETPEILRLPGLRVFHIALGDTSRMLDVPMEYEHPKVWRFLDETIEIARASNIDICANTGRTYIDRDEIARRVKRMFDRGIRMILIQNQSFLVQMLSQDLLARVRSEIGY